MRYLRLLSTALACSLAGIAYGQAPANDETTDDARKTIVDALHDSLKEDPETQSATILWARPTASGQVFVRGVATSDAQKAIVKTKGEQALQGYIAKKLLVWEYANSPQLDTSRMVVASSSTLRPLEIVNVIDALLPNEDEQVLRVEHYATQGRKVRLCGTVQSKQDLQTLALHLQRLDYVDSVDAGSVVAIDQISLEKLGPHIVYTLEDALGHRSGDELLATSEAMMLTDLKRGKPFWQYRAIGHLYLGDHERAAGAIRIAQAIHERATLPPRFQGPLRLYYNWLKELGPRTALGIPAPPTE